MALFGRDKAKKDLSAEVRLIPQADAEKDTYLIDCFLDSGYIDKLIKENYTIISGRKGSGKTAIAKYLQATYLDYDLLFSHRIAVSELSKLAEKDESPVDNTAIYLLSRTAQLLMEQKLLSHDGEVFWKEYFGNTNFESITEYSEWVEFRKTQKQALDAGAGIPQVAKFNAEKETQTELTKSNLIQTPTSLLQKLIQSYAVSEKTLIFLDDLTDHLDREDADKLQAGLEVVRDILHKIDNFNSTLSEANVGLRFICNVREDLWEFISGSNENKLVSSSLKIVWDEETFCKLLIKRLPNFYPDQEEALSKPKEYIKKIFPDEIFKVNSTNVHRYSTNFYTYMQLISFNRPRDFLKFGVAMKPRLSEKKPIEQTHIQAAEQEYTDYFYQEVEDELSLLTKKMGFESPKDSVFKIIHALSEEADGFSYTHLRTELAKSFNKSSHSEVYKFLKILWNYSILGIKKVDQEKNSLLMFRHTDPGQRFPLEDNCKSYRYQLHRGLYWYIKKND